VRHLGAGAYTNALLKADVTNSGACISATLGNGTPCDPNDYDNDAGIEYTADYRYNSGTGVIMRWNTDWDTGGHNTMRVHYDIASNLLIDHNLVGPGCMHNCIYTKGINGTVSNNVTTCPTSSARGWQCANSSGAPSAGLYTENSFVSPGTHPTYSGNVTHDIGRGIEIEANANGSGTSFNITPTILSNSAYNTSTHTLELNGSCTGANVQKNIFASGASMTNLSSCASTYDYNDAFSVSGGITGGGHNISLDPSFTNTATFNFKPTNATVCAAGVPATVNGNAYLGAIVCP